MRKQEDISSACTNREQTTVQSLLTFFKPRTFRVVTSVNRVLCMHSYICHIISLVHVFTPVACLTVPPAAWELFCTFLCKQGSSGSQVSYLRRSYVTGFNSMQHIWLASVTLKGMGSCTYLSTCFWNHLPENSHSCSISLLKKRQMVVRF